MHDRRCLKERCLRYHNKVLVLTGFETEWKVFEKCSRMPRRET